MDKIRRLIDARTKPIRLTEPLSNQGGMRNSVNKASVHGGQVLEDILRGHIAYAVLCDCDWLQWDSCVDADSSKS